MESWELLSALGVNVVWVLISQFVISTFSGSSKKALAGSSSQLMSYYHQFKASSASALLLVIIIFILKYLDRISNDLSLVVILIACSIVIIRLLHVLFVSSRFVRAAYEVGLSGVDPEIDKGTDYDDSLDLCKREFQFLGIGAHKLISSGRLEGAVKRCGVGGGGEARFLLCHPDSEALRAMERRNNVPVGQYRDRIIESLEVLSGLVDKDYRIQVRLYNKEDLNDIPVFRLMIIDQERCLVSFHVIDEDNNEGRLLPQFHIQDHERKNGMPTFYKPYSTYFENLWESSEDDVGPQAISTTWRV